MRSSRIKDYGPARSWGHKWPITLTDPASSNFIGEDDFSWSIHPFTTNYTLSGDLTNITNGCAGFGVRRVSVQGYALYVCADGTVKIRKYDAKTGQPTSLLSAASVTASAVYRVLVSAQQNTLSITINGQRFSITDKNGPYLTTDNVTLALYQLTLRHRCLGEFQQLRLHRDAISTRHLPKSRFFCYSSDKVIVDRG